MRQHNDTPIQEMLTRARKSLLNVDDITILNSKIVVTIPILNPNEHVVMVQRNATRHMINRIQIRRFSKANNRDVILFPTEHYRTKKDGGQIVNDTDLLNVQDDDGSIGPGILYYCKGMPTCLLTNSSTQLDIVNGAQTLVSRVIPNPQGNTPYFDTFNFAYHYPRFLHTA